MNKDNLLLVGKIIGAYGIRGEVKIFPYGDSDKKPWKKVYLLKKGHSLICEVADNRPHKGVILASLTGYNDRDSADKLIGFDVFIDKTELPLLPEGEYYNFQLQDMEVITDNGKTIGVITDIVSTGGNDVYVVKGAYGEILIPAIGDVVLKIDVKARKMVIHLLEGLLEENRL